MRSATAPVLSSSDGDALSKSGATEQIPFTVIDEGVHVLDTPLEPWSIQFEVRVSGHLDEDRLRRAIGEALARHPMARARMVPPRFSARRLMWEITSEPEVDPLRVVDCPDDAALDRARAELYSLSVPLAESPPLRFRLARNPGGDFLFLNVNHAAFDGFGCARLVHSVARAYTGQPDPDAPVPLDEARDIEVHLGSDDTPTRRRRMRLLMDKLRDLIDPPARLAAEGAAEEPGYGFHHLTLPPEQARRLSKGVEGATVNDLLLAALHASADRWNRHHDAACRRVGVLVPVNLRPSEWREDVVTNFVLDARVATSVTDRRDARSLVEAVAAQGELIKKGGGAALYQVLRSWPSLPLWAKQATSPVLRITGSRLVDTALLSNLGKVDDPPSFAPDAGDTTEVWFSAPARMPCGLTVGAVTTDGGLHLAFRYRPALFGAQAARGFAECYVGELEELASVLGDRDGDGEGDGE